MRYLFFFFAFLSFFSSADYVPADGRPPDSCDTWSAEAIGTGKHFSGCGPQSAADAAFAYLVSVGLDGCTGTYDRNCRPVAATQYWYVYGEKCRYRRDSGECFEWLPSSVIKTSALRNYGISYICPPSEHPMYVIGPIDINGSKYCFLPDGQNDPKVKECQEKSGTVLNRYWMPAEYNSVCYGGCVVEPNVSGGVLVSEYYTSESGDKFIRTSHGIRYTGEVCGVVSGDTFDYDPDSSGDASPGNDDAMSQEKEESKKADCTPVYNEAIGTSTCTATSFTKKPGTNSCGYINGTFTCTDNGDGESVTTTVDKSVSDVTDPDTNIVTSTETKTTTEETCSGSDCKTTSKTEVTTTRKDSNGNVIGSSADCTGDGCADDEGGALTQEEYEETNDKWGEDLADKIGTVPDSSEVLSSWDEYEKGFENYQETTPDYKQPDIKSIWSIGGGSCSGVTVDAIGGNKITINGHCRYYGEYNAIMNWFIALLTAWQVLGIFHRMITGRM